MDFGVFIFWTAYAIDPARLATEAEQRGFESLFCTEHTHIPLTRRPPLGADGSELPGWYAETYDPFVALATAAAVTERIKLGTGVCLVVERDPIVLAKEVASIDRLSGGRFLFGVGAGWNRDEMRDHGTDPRVRMGVLAERVQAMKAIWTEDEPEFHGRYVDFPPMWSWPKPVQKPHPPVLVGGMGPRVVDRVVEFGEEWLPLSVGEGNMAEFSARARELQDRAAAAGRGPIPITMFDASADPATIERYADAGVTRCVFHLPSAPADEVLPLLDEYARVSRR